MGWSAMRFAPTPGARPRCLIPSSILRSITSEPGSIGSIPMRAISVGSRNRLRLMRRVRPSRSSSTNVQTQLPSSDRQARTCSGIDLLDAHPVRAVGRSCRRSAGAGTRAGRDRRCACRARGRSRSSRRCRRRHVGPGPSARATATRLRRVRRSRRRESRRRQRLRVARPPADAHRPPPRWRPRSGHVGVAAANRANTARPPRIAVETDAPTEFGRSLPAGVPVPPAAYPDVPSLW